MMGKILKVIGCFGLWIILIYGWMTMAYDRWFAANPHPSLAYDWWSAPNSHPSLLGWMGAIALSVAFLGISGYFLLGLLISLFASLPPPVPKPPSSSVSPPG